MPKSCAQAASVSTDSIALAIRPYAAGGMAACFAQISVQPAGKLVLLPPVAPPNAEMFGVLELASFVHPQTR
jgi:hypothetical protein